jgi:DNA ligase-1
MIRKSFKVFVSYLGLIVIGKIGTGFSDADLTSLTLLLDTHKRDRAPSNFVYSDVPNIKPDVWFDPAVLFEVKAADLSLSPVHKAGIGLVASDVGRGISLRFPRFMRVRDDKGVKDATGSEQVKDMYLSQDCIKGGKKESGGAVCADDDFEF